MPSIQFYLLFCGKDRFFLLKFKNGKQKFIKKISMKKINIDFVAVIIFTTDNGGAVTQNSNLPLKGNFSLCYVTRAGGIEPTISTT